MSTALIMDMVCTLVHSDMGYARRIADVRACMCLSRTLPARSGDACRVDVLRVGLVRVTGYVVRGNWNQCLWWGLGKTHWAKFQIPKTTDAVSPHMAPYTCRPRQGTPYMVQAAHAGSSNTAFFGVRR